MGKAKTKKKPAARKKPAIRQSAQPAHRKAASAQKLGHLAATAMRGEIDALFELMDGAAADNDVLAYKWLVVAADFGHEAAEDAIDDLLEVSSLRYDDDRYETGNAHFELGMAYLTASEGLPRDLAKARGQLVAAKERNFPISVQQGEQILAASRLLLVESDARAVFDAVYDGSPVVAAPTGEDHDEDDDDEDYAE